DGPVHPRLAQIRGHLHTGDRHEPNPGIAHAARDQLAEKMLDHLRDALGPVVRGHSRSSSFSQPGSRCSGSSSSSRSGGSRDRSCASKSGFADQSPFISEYVSISISRLRISAMLPASRAHLSSTSLTKL